MAPKPPRRSSRPGGAVARLGNRRASDRSGAGAGGEAAGRRGPAGPWRPSVTDVLQIGAARAQGGQAVARRAPAEPWRASVTDVLQIVAARAQGVKPSLVAPRRSRGAPR